MHVHAHNKSSLAHNVHTHPLLYAVPGMNPQQQAAQTIRMQLGLVNQQYATVCLA